MIMNEERDADEEENAEYKGRSVSKDDLKIMEYIYGVFVEVTTKDTPLEKIPELVKSVREKKMPQDDELKERVEAAYEALVALSQQRINRPRRDLSAASLDFRRKICHARELYDNIYYNNRDHCEGNDRLEKDCADSS
jgi:hypothetical protein